MISLSFDTDHCDEARMREFLAEVPIPGSATLFCTEAYADVGEGHEICAHAVLESENWDGPLDEARRMFPDARGFRAHGCLWSHGLSLELAQRGYDYVSAHDNYGRPGIEPYQETWGVWHLPIYYCDTLDLSFERHWGELGSRKLFDPALIERAGEDEGTYVFAFHPVHLLLNTTTVDDYLSRRDQFRAGVPLRELRCEGYGAGSYYSDLVDSMAAKGIESTPLGKIVDELSEALGHRV